MIYYICLLITIFSLRLLTYRFNKFKKGDKIFVFGSCLLVVLFQGFRDFAVGIDLQHYIPYFEKMGNLPFGDLHIANFEPGYVLFNKIIYNLGFNERGLILFIAALIQIPIFITIYKFSDDVLMSILWYFSFGEFIFTFSGLRQAIAMSICFAGFYFVKEKKFFPFLLSCILAATFHKSALISLVIYPAFNIKISNKWIFITGISCFIVFIFNKKILQFITEYFYSSYGEISNTGAYTLLIVYFLIYIISFKNDKPDEMFIGMRNILLILVMIYCFAPVSQMFTRIGFVFELYLSLFIPKVVKSLKFKPKRAYYGGCYAVLTLCIFRFIGMFQTLPFRFEF